MCLLITAPANGNFISDEWLQDFYTKNSDGFGIMYAENGTLHIRKQLGTPEDFISMWRETEQYERAIHLRMRTHGDIDLINCHPYEIFGAESDNPMWLMHNGILSTGNAADTTKSDTWHYIRDYLVPMLKDNQDFAFHPAFAKLIGDHIGSSNKFVIMDSKGRVAHINRTSGVEWEGMWLSNTYAWNATKAGVLKPYSYSYGTSGASRFSRYGYEDDEEYGGWWTRALPSETGEATDKAEASALDEDFDTEIFDGYEDYDELDQCLEYLLDMGASRAAYINYDQYESFCYKFGVEALWDLVILMDEAEITEQDFIRLVSDFRLFREKMLGEEKVVQ